MTDPGNLFGPPGRGADDADGRSGAGRGTPPPALSRRALREAGRQREAAEHGTGPATGRPEVPADPSPWPLDPVAAWPVDQVRAAAPERDHRHARDRGDDHDSGHDDHHGDHHGDHDDHDDDHDEDDGGRRPPGRGGWRMPLAALLNAVWAAMCFVDVEGMAGVVPITLATMAPLASVAAVAVATVALHGRRWVSGGLAVVAGVVPWVFVLGYAVADQPGTGGDAATLTVLVVNAHDGRADPQDIVAAVAAHDVDLLVVTELSRTLAHDLTESRLTQFLAPQWFSVDDDPEAGLGIWSELDVTDAELLGGTRWPAVRAAVHGPTGPVTVVAGHAAPPVPSGADVWAADLAAFGAAARGRDRTMLVGCFNATPWHAQYRRMLAAAGLSDAADVRGRGLRPTWPTWTPLPLVPMDDALVSKDLGVRSADTVAIDGTDHRALLVGLEVP